MDEILRGLTDSKQYVVITITDESGNYIGFNVGIDYDFKYLNTETYLNDKENITTSVFFESEYQDYLDFVAELLADDDAKFMPSLQLLDTILV